MLKLVLVYESPLLPLTRSNQAKVANTQCEEVLQIPPSGPCFAGLSCRQ